MNIDSKKPDHHSNNSEKHIELETAESLSFTHIKNEVFNINKEDFIKNFYKYILIMRDFYNKQYVYKNPTPEREIVIESFEKLLYSKTRELKLPYIYELLLDQYTKINTEKNEFGYLGALKRIDENNMSTPVITKDKNGKDIIIMSDGNVVKISNIKNKDIISSILGYEEMLSYDLMGGLAKVFKKYFTREINLEDFGLNNDDMHMYAMCLAGGFYSSIKDFHIPESDAKPYGRYMTETYTDDRDSFYFTKFLLHCDKDSFMRLKNFSNKYLESGIKTFLSIREGKIEMGDKILHLSENLPENEATEVFNGYGNLIDNTNILGSKISKHIEKIIKNNKIPNGVDIGKLPNELMNALMLRAKDVLVGADKVLENQLAGAEEKLNTKDVTDAVLGINTLVSMLSNIGEQSDYVYKKIDSIGNKPGETLTKYIVTDASGIEYALKIFIRPNAEKDAQARVNIELSFDTEKPNERLQKAFYNETVNHKENKTSAGSVLRIGIDRDDFNHTGAVSLDLGRSERNTERYSRTGDVLGKLLSMTSAEGHHETSAFSKEFADEKVFESVTTMLAGYFANQETS